MLMLQAGDYNGRSWNNRRCTDLSGLEREVKDGTRFV